MGIAARSLLDPQNMNMKMSDFYLHFKRRIFWFDLEDVTESPIVKNSFHCSYGSVLQFYISFESHIFKKNQRNSKKRIYQLERNPTC